MRQCQALTNLGNLFSNTGRVCLAIGLWDRALAIDPYFSMALFSKAEGLCALANMLYDESHIALIYEEVYALYSLIDDERFVTKIEPHVVKVRCRQSQEARTYRFLFFCQRERPCFPLFCVLLVCEPRL